MDTIELVEVGPRDGFQLVQEFIPTETKIDLVRGLYRAGLRRIEVGSFVNPRLVPQMRDAAAVLAAALALDGLRASVLVPNRKGAELAIAAGAQELVFVCSASEAHNRENVRRTVAESLGELAGIVADLAGHAGVAVRLAVSTAFDCPFTGSVPDERVIALLDNAAEVLAGAEVALCDTTGRAAPDHVRRLVELCLGRYRDRGLRFALHAHDTYGMAIANVVAARDAGVRVFDAAVAGLGGCPFAPGASGNVATEDVVYLFEAMRTSTGIDLEALLAVADAAAALPGAVAGGRVRSVPRRRAPRDRDQPAAMGGMS